MPSCRLSATSVAPGSTYGTATLTITALRLRPCECLRIDGQTYDMSSPASQQQMMNNGLIYFTNQVRAAIIAVDPTALVDVGFFWPQAPNPTRIGDPRVIELYPMMANSTADFVKISSPDSRSELTIPQLVQSYGFVGYQQQKPLLMAEVDANESDFPLISDAVTRLQNWQIDSCPYSVKGWLLWTWVRTKPSSSTIPRTGMRRLATARSMPPWHLPHVQTRVNDNCSLEDLILRVGPGIQTPAIAPVRQGNSRLRTTHFRGTCAFSAGQKRPADQNATQN